MIPVHSSGIRASGLWVEFEGHLYPAVDGYTNFSISWFGEGSPGEEWHRYERPSESSEDPSEYVRTVSAKDVTRYASLATEATWGDRRFDVMGFKSDDRVVLFACVSREEALALVAGEHSWEMIDRGYVSGVVPVDELTDVVETSEELPLSKV